MGGEGEKILKYLVEKVVTRIIEMYTVYVYHIMSGRTTTDSVEHCTKAEKHFNELIYSWFLYDLSDQNCTAW